MKWFQHQSNAHRDFNIEPFVDKFGMEGYGLYWICAEIIAEKGDVYQISEKQGWKRYLISRSRFPEGKVDEMLFEMAELNLIDKNNFKKGILHMPKMSRYSDDYTKKVRREYEQGTESVRTVSVPDKIRGDKKREDKIKIDKIILENIYTTYKKKINKLSRLTPSSKKKIDARSKEYSADDLLKAIGNFSKSKWWMDKNSHRGIAWFFHSEDRIDQFLNLKEDKGPGVLKLSSLKE